jgi:hypothetical protein
MGGTLHRLEILLVGVVLLLAGAVVAALTLLSPPAPVVYERVTPQPVATRSTDLTPLVATTQPPATRTTAQEGVRTAAQPVPFWQLELASALPALRVAGACALITIGVVALGYVAGRRLRPRMAYTGQSIGMLLGAADRATRASNLRIMRDLHARGQLSSELAVAAGLRRVSWWPQLHLPCLVLPTIARPRLRLPTLQRPRLRIRIPVPQTKRVLGTPQVPVVNEADETRVAVSPAQNAGAWEAEDLAYEVAAAIGNVWAEWGIASQVLALDTRVGRGKGRVLVTIDVLPDEEARFGELPAVLEARQPAWKVRWQSAGRGTAMLAIDVSARGERPVGGPMLIPALAHGKGNGTLRFVPLATVNHLGIYGSGATQTLHAILTSLLYTQPPDALAVAMWDTGQITPLYRGVAHLVPPPEELDRVTRAATPPFDGTEQARDVRPVLLVVIEPEAVQLAALTAMLQRLRSQPTSTVHLILVQEHLRPEGQELYALLPALVSGVGRGDASLLSGQHEWPNSGRARLLCQGMRMEGHARGIDEGAAGALLAPLRRQVLDLPPVLWEMDRSCVAPTTQATAASETARQSNNLVAAPASDGGGEQSMVVAMPADRSVASLRSGEDASHDWLRGLLDRDQQATAIDLGGVERAVLAAQRPDVAITTPARANGWPDGPAPLSSNDLAALVERMLTSPVVIAGQDDQRGLSKRRIAELLSLSQARARAVADILMVWFDQAGILEPPRQPGRLHHPRMPAATDLDAIAAKLRATPLPGEAECRAAWAASASEAGIQ